MINRIRGTPVDDNIVYADIDDVKLYLRSFSFSDDSNPSKTQVEKMIKNKTDEFERRIQVRAFRLIEVKDLEIDINPDYTQSVDTTSRYSATNTLKPTLSGKRKQYIRVKLPHKRINSIDNIKTITDGNVGKSKNVSEDEYLIDKTNGIIRIKTSAFYQTASGGIGNNRFKDARIKIDYTYGEKNNIPHDVKECVAKMVVYDLVNSDAFGQIISDEVDFVSPDEYTSRLNEEINDIINRYKGVR